MKKQKQAIDITFKKILKAKETSIAICGSIAASLSSLNDIPFNWEDIDRIVNATRSHSIKGAEYVNKLPGELERFGNAAVEAYIKGGDELGKHWSHIKSQKNYPELSSNASNAILEDGSLNVSRRATNMTLEERAKASIDNHIDGFKTIYTTPEFWQRTLGNAFEASVYALAISAIDQVLINREKLLNGSEKDRRELFLEILKTSGLIGAGSLPVSIFLGICLMLIPGLSTVLGPIGLIGSTGLGLRLIKSAVDNPTTQEINVIKSLHNFFQKFSYDFPYEVKGTKELNVANSSEMNIQKYWKYN
tara:strand:- start:471 stop:1385 length:915 start_codon:yes stop_codon:yes gene_type:complete